MIDTILETRFAIFVGVAFYSARPGVSEQQELAPDPPNLRHWCGLWCPQPREQRRWRLRGGLWVSWGGAKG